MSSKPFRFVVMVLVLGGLVPSAPKVSGQPFVGTRSPPQFSRQGQPSTRNGEWPHYAADMKGTRYSPLDQIDASNFNKLRVA